MKLNTGAKEIQPEDSGGPYHLVNRYVLVGTVIASEVRPTGVQEESKVATTKHAVCCNTLML